MAARIHREDLIRVQISTARSKRAFSSGVEHRIRIAETRVRFSQGPKTERTPSVFFVAIFDFNILKLLTIHLLTSILGVVELNHIFKAKRSRHNFKIKNMRKKFGQTLKELRIKKELTLRHTCRLVNYDPSNWSKIERGKMSPPSDKKTLRKWAMVLGMSNKSGVQKFIDEANLAQGIIPQDILSQSNVVDFLPAFFRTLRNKKPTKKEIDRLIKLIKDI